MNKEQDQKITEQVLKDDLWEQKSDLKGWELTKAFLDKLEKQYEKKHDKTK